MVNNAHIISFSAEESRSAVSTVLYSCKYLEMYLLEMYLPFPLYYTVVNILKCIC